jgi:lysophospholipase L1-like esterase
VSCRRNNMPFVEIKTGRRSGLGRTRGGRVSKLIRDRSRRPPSERHTISATGHHKDLRFRRALLVLTIALTVHLTSVGGLAQAVLSSTSAPPTALLAAPTAGNPFESEVTALETKLSQSTVTPGPIVFYGSSSIRLWKSLAQDFPDYSVLNCGFGGSRLADCARYANRLVLPRKPSAVVIYAGDNDLALGTAPEKAFQTFQQLFGIFRNYSPSMPIAFVSVKPSPARCMYLDNIRRFNRLVEDYLQTRPETDYIDVFSDMLGPDQKPIPSLFVNDKIHLSPAGYQILRREVGEFLTEDCSKNKGKISP